MHSTLDHAFVLKSLVDIFALTKKKLYCAFIDYKKAFDSIWRQALWYKLMNYGISGKILQVVINMYNQIKSCVFLDGQKSDFFGSFKGVRQGENLSPLLFSLFLNDLEDFFVDNGCSNLNCDLNIPGMDLEKFIRLLVLLYADDTILLASSRFALQKELDVLNLYCQKWQLEVNPTKSKVVIFHGRNCTREKIFFGDERIEILSSLKYLGIEFAKSGSFFKARKSAYNQAL